jgi:hypothetical protein
MILFRGFNRLGQFVNWHEDSPIAIGEKLRLTFIAGSEKAIRKIGVRLVKCQGKLATRAAK